MAYTLSTFRSIDLDESEEAVKASSGSIFSILVGNNNAALRYLKLYDATVAGTVVGTTTPVATIPLQATETTLLKFDRPLFFSTAITAAATTGVADNDTGAPGANEVVVLIQYE